MSPQSPTLRHLWSIGADAIHELATSDGILASGREEIYGCIFGRDSLITALKLLRTYEVTRDPYYLGVARTTLSTLAKLQGQTVNIESGEEPGKCIHEFRPARHEHLTQHPVDPWYVYPDNVMRNYDSIDSTLLLLMTFLQYSRVADDPAFIEEMTPNILHAYDWMFMYGDKNDDGFFDYQRPLARKSGGLVTQSWMDSRESVFHEDGQPVVFPVAPVEIQAYAYAALRLGARHFAERQPLYARFLHSRADRLKRQFAEAFVLRDASGTHVAAALDHNGRALRSVRSSMGHCLWAVSPNRFGQLDSILDEATVSAVVRRLLAPDMFVAGAGIRTLSTASTQFQPQSYHNGSIWPHDNSLIIEGMQRHGYYREARRVRLALIRAYEHFQTPVELYVYDGGLQAYRSPTGQTACQTQAWSAAAMLHETSILRQRRSHLHRFWSTTFVDAVHPRRVKLAAAALRSKMNG